LARGVIFRSALASRAGAGQGGGSAQGLNRMGAGFGGGSGQFESKALAAARGRCAGGQAEMGEDLGNHGGVYDGGDHLQGATAMGAVLQIDIEHPFTKALPGFRPAGRRSPFKTAPGGFVSEQRAQLRRAGAAGGGASAWSAEGVLGFSGTLGMISGRSLALRPRRAKQAPTWACFRVRARHGSGLDATADGEPARRVAARIQAVSSPGGSCRRLNRCV
jgi:hypothetical protein